MDGITLSLKDFIYLILFIAAVIGWFATLRHTISKLDNKIELLKQAKIEKEKCSELRTAIAKRLSELQSRLQWIKGFLQQQTSAGGDEPR